MKNGKNLKSAVSAEAAPKKPIKRHVYNIEVAKVTIRGIVIIETSVDRENAPEASLLSPSYRSEKIAQLPATGQDIIMAQISRA